MRRKVLKDVEHGKTSTYKKGCRCFICTKAHSANCRKSRGSSSKEEIDKLTNTHQLFSS